MLKDISNYIATLQTLESSAKTMGILNNRVPWEIHSKKTIKAPNSLVSNTKMCGAGNTA